MGSTHSQRLERWFGKEVLEQASAAMRGWYGKPIPIMDSGGVSVGSDGDFIGYFRGGGFASYSDYLYETAKSRARRFATKQQATANMAFSSLSDLISEATTGGKRIQLYFQKNFGAHANTGFAPTWNRSVFPAAGGAAAAIPGGTAYSNSTTGAMKFTSPAASDKLYLLSTMIAANGNNNALLLLDRTFAASSIQLNTTSNQAVSGVPTRYQESDTAIGTFVTLQNTSATGATACNMTITYVDQDGNTAEAGAAFPVLAGAANQNQLITSGNWYYPLNEGDRGVRSVTNFALSAICSGTAEIQMGKPIAWMMIAQATSLGGIVYSHTLNSFFPIEIHPSACLTHLGLPGSSGVAVWGEHILVSA